jgi:hypothetical protein
MCYNLCRAWIGLVVHEQLAPFPTWSKAKGLHFSIIWVEVMRNALLHAGDKGFTCEQGLSTDVAR